MYSENRKIYLVQEVLKINSEAVLAELENVLIKAGHYKKKKPLTAHDFLGTISKKDAALIDAAIEKGCEQINPDDWK